MTGSKSLGRVLALVCIVLACLPAAAHGALTPWRLDPWGGWEALEPVNPYATIQGGNPVSGWGNAGSSAVQITARAEVAFDANKAELTADFVPVSREIIESDPRLFIAPLGRRLEWKVILTVRNPNDIPMHGAKVQGSFGPAFRATLSGRSQGDARITGDDPRGMLPMDASFVWDVGDLGPNEAARAEISVATRRDSSGRQEFAQEGVYPVDSGFKLTYSLLGKAQVRNTSPCSVIARVNPEALRPDGGPYDVAQKPIEQDWPFPERPFPERPVPVRPGPTNPLPAKPGTGLPAATEPPSVQNGKATIMRKAPELTAEQIAQLEESGDVIHKDPKGRFSVTAVGITDNINEVDGRFVVPQGEKAEWEVDLAVKNIFWLTPWSSWEATLDFGPELKVELAEGSPSSNSAVTIVENPETGTLVVWRNKGALLAGRKATAKLKVSTRGPGHYEGPGQYVFAENIELNYSYCLIFIPVSDTVELKSINVDVEDAPPSAEISVSATRVDWRVRKPGTYAAEATTVTASGTGTLSMQFSKFSDLSSADGVLGTIAAFYGFGDSLAAAEAGGWISAAELNNTTRYIDLSEPEPVLMWSKISVGEEVSSAEYENEGVITFIVSNTQIGEGN
jgi:hypothetical protein